MQETVAKPAIYISYAWNSESEGIADSIVKEFDKKGVRIIRDKTDLKYKGRIKEFMKDIGLGKYVILIISNKYLRSENCMFELVQIFKNQNFYERIFPVVLDEVKIAKATDRLDLMKYWENEVDNLDNKIRELKELTNIQGVTDDLNLYTEIRNNIAGLTNILKDINTLNTDRHISSDFVQLYELVQTKIKSDLESKNGSDKPNKKIKKAILYPLGLIAIILIVQVFYENSKLNPDNDIENASNSELKEGDSLQMTQVKDTMSIKKKETVKEETKQPLSNTFYNVTLLVPSYMAKENVYVDNELAEVVERSLNSITVRLREKNSSHHFEIGQGNQTCVADKLISQDSVRMTLLCD